MGWVPCVLNLSIDKGDMVLYFRIVSTYMHRESKSVATVHTLTNFIISQVHWLNSQDLAIRGNKLFLALLNQYNLMLH